MDRKPGKPDQSDHKRLQQIEQSDLSESRVNQDFVDWLKTKGPNYLLVILAALCVYMLIVRWNQSKTQKHVEAWNAAMTADLPLSKEDVAEEYSDVPGVAEYSYLTAARQYLASVRINATIESMIEQATALANVQQPTPNMPNLTKPLTEEQREQNLAEAHRLFQLVIDRLADVTTDSEPGRVLLKTAAMEGLATVAEARGDVETAAQRFQEAAALAEGTYPALAAQARSRAANVSDYAEQTTLPTVAEVGGRATIDTFQTTPQTTPMLPSLESIISANDTTTTADASTQP